MMDETTIRMAIRATARISFVLFLCAFLGDTLYRLMPAAATRWLKGTKDGFTLGFAGSHTVHLVFICAFLGDTLYRLMPAAATRWLKGTKDGFTLGFAGSHTVHLVFILALI